MDYPINLVTNSAHIHLKTEDDYWRFIISCPHRTMIGASCADCGTVFLWR